MRGTDIKHGIVRCVNRCGYITEAQYEYGLQNGYLREIFHDGVHREGLCKDDRPVGVEILYGLDGQEIEREDHGHL